MGDAVRVARARHPHRFKHAAAAQLVYNSAGVPLVGSVAIVRLEATDVVGSRGRYPLKQHGELSSELGANGHGHDLAGGWWVVGGGWWVVGGG